MTGTRQNFHGVAGGRARPGQSELPPPRPSPPRYHRSRRRRLQNATHEASGRGGKRRGGRTGPAPQSRPAPRCGDASLLSHRARWSTHAAPPHGGSVPPGRLVVTGARRLSPAGPADPTMLSRSRRLSPAVHTGLNPRPGPLGGVPTGRMVNPRGQGQEAQSRWAGLWSTVLGGSVPTGRLVDLGGPRSDDESRRAGWSTPATCVRRLSHALPAGGAPRREAESRRAGWSNPAGPRPEAVPPGTLDQPRGPASGY